jgi:DNA-binding NarL/FixJ family response regulator
MADCDISESAVRIVVADDFQLWRRHVIGQLQSRNDVIVVGEASDGLEALRKVRQLAPSLILLDVGLPEMNGIAATSAIVRMVPDCKIVILSAHSGSAIVGAAFRAGARGYLLKSDAGRELIPAIEVVLRGDLYVSRSLASDNQTGEHIVQFPGDEAAFRRTLPQPVRTPEKSHRLTRG